MDLTREVLSKFISVTNELITDALRLYDPSSKSEIITTMELGFPNDIIRLAGGFGIGLCVKWDSSISFIPVDTTVNVCTTSLFTLSGDIREKITPILLKNIEDKILQSGFRPNFTRGNHFIIYAKSRFSNQYYLILHSDTYNDGYESLSPESGNWYYNDIKTLIKGNRYLRYITGDLAQEYYAKVKYHETKNAIKHSCVANSIVENEATIKASQILHHHTMPFSSSILIGCYLINANTTVPILSSEGQPIYLYRFDKSLEEQNNIGGNYFIAPHGWGKHFFEGNFSIDVNIPSNTLLLNDEVFTIQPKQTFISSKNIKMRSFVDSDRNDTYIEYLHNFYTGTSIDMLDQLISYNKSGFKRFQR